MENFLGLRSGVDTLLDHQHSLKLASHSSKILELLISSKEDGQSIGINSPLVGEGFFITAVEEVILVEGEIIILIKPFDITGFILPTNKLRLDDITAVCPFKSEFENPVLKNIEKDKTWFF